MGETLFLVNEHNDLRIRFVQEGERITGVTAIYIDGNTTEYPRQVN
jgi:hypothetical protein